MKVFKQVKTWRTNLAIDWLHVPKTINYRIFKNVKNLQIAVIMVAQENWKVELKDGKQSLAEVKYREKFSKDIHFFHYYLYINQIKSWKKQNS